MRSQDSKHIIQQPNFTGTEPRSREGYQLAPVCILSQEWGQNYETDFQFTLHVLAHSTELKDTLQRTT